MRHVVVGGGIAGFCCAEELCRLCPNDQVTLVSPTRVLKGIANVVRLTQNLESFDVVERELDDPNLTTVLGEARALDTQSRTLLLASGEELGYDRLCIATGTRPRLVSDHPCLLALRDTDSVEDLKARLKGARRVAIVGNGGIALELAAMLTGVEVVWSMRHDHIGDAFFDKDAAEFLLSALARQGDGGSTDGGAGGGTGAGTVGEGSGGGGDGDGGATEGQGVGVGSEGDGAGVEAGAEGAAGVGRARGGGAMGHAVGPRWAEALAGIRAMRQGLGDDSAPANGADATHTGATDTAPDTDTGIPAQSPLARAPRAPSGAVLGRPGLVLEPQTELAGIEPDPLGSYPAVARLTNGRAYPVDVVICAVGVMPNTEWLAGAVELCEEGGVLVDEDMQSSVEGVYAAGDACMVREGARGAQWFPMRLWTQARAMGMCAGRCMAGRGADLAVGMRLEVFAHVTRFCGLKVVLLGLYNGQRLEGVPASDVALYAREGEDEGGRATFVRVLLVRGRMQGAVLIGETGLEETFENLILDQLDLTDYGPQLLDPEFDVDHHFD